MKKLVALLGVVILGVSTATMRADGIGQPVTGTLNLPLLGSTNWFNGVFGFVPPGYGNFGTSAPVTIGAGTEFGFSNGVDLITANFTGTTLTVTDACVVAGCANTAFHATFFSPYILGYSVQSVAFPDGVFFNFVGGTLLTIDSLGSATGKGGTLTFTYSSVPEPGTFGLLATGVLGAAGAFRRRFLA